MTGAGGHHGGSAWEEVDSEGGDPAHAVRAVSRLILVRLFLGLVVIFFLFLFKWLME